MPRDLLRQTPCLWVPASAVAAAREPVAEDSYRGKSQLGGCAGLSFVSSSSPPTATAATTTPAAATTTARVPVAGGLTGLQDPSP